MGRLKHVLRPTDNQGYHMECIICGCQWYLLDDNWNNKDTENCKGAKK